MERLTVKHYLGSDYYMKCSEECNVDMDCIDCPAFEKLVDRLAAYEDTGLEPEEIRVLSATEKRMDRLEADGRLVVLPCKIGDKAYGIRRNAGGEYYIAHSHISEMFYTKDMKLIVVLAYVCRGEMGKKVFMTYEEAEDTMDHKGVNND